MLEQYKKYNKRKRKMKMQSWSEIKDKLNHK